MGIAFDHRHYVPILRWKGGEKRALRELYAHDRLRITPLLELPAFNSAGDPPPDGRRKTMQELAEEVEKCWQYGLAFFDLRALDTSRLPGIVHSIEQLFAAAAERGLRLVPVTGLSRSFRYQRAVSHVLRVERRGVCLRLHRSDLRDLNLRASIEVLFRQLDVSPTDVDLVVDLEIVDDTGYDLVNVCAQLPYLHDWRSFTIAGGAFPKDLTNFTPGSHLVPRSEWLAWTDGIRQNLPRLPTYGDYAMIHPFLGEYVPGMDTSASIRYTSENHWLVLRGEALRKEGSGGHAQYPAQAQLLCSRSAFRGREFSAGDMYVDDIRTRKKNTGNPTTWLGAGVNHHLTFVVLQLANLFDSSTGGAR